MSNTLPTPASAPPSAAPEESINPVGDWRLVSMKFVSADTGEAVDLWGASPVGQLSYRANGRMIAVVTGDPKMRKPVVPGSDTLTADAAALYRTCSAYSGTWSLSGTTMTHKVDVAVNAGWVGTDQVRYVKLDGDTMTIESAPFTASDGNNYKSKMVWERVK